MTPVVAVRSIMVASRENVLKQIDTCDAVIVKYLNTSTRSVNRG